MFHKHLTNVVWGYKHNRHIPSMSNPEYNTYNLKDWMLTDYQLVPMDDYDDVYVMYLLINDMVKELLIHSETNPEYITKRCRTVFITYVNLSIALSKVMYG